MRRARETTRATSFALLTLLWLAGLVAGAQFGKVALVLPEIAERYPEAGASLGFAISAISLVGAALGLVAGLIAPRIGAWRLLTGALALGAAMSLVQAAPLGWGMFLVTRTVEGASHLGVVVSAPLLMARIAPPSWRGPAMTAWGTFFGAAFVVTATFGLPLAQTHGVPTLLFAHGVVATLVTAGVFAAGRWLRSTAPTAHEPLATRTLLRRHLAAYASPFVAAPAAGWFALTATFTALVTFLPTLAGPDARSAVATAMPLASLVVTFATGALLTRWRAVGVIVAGFIGALLVGVSLFMLPVTLATAVAMAGVLGLVQGASFAAVPQLNPAEADQALGHGAMAQTGNLGNLIGPPLLLVVLQSFGTNGLIVGVMAFHALGLTAHLVLARRRAPR